MIIAHLYLTIRRDDKFGTVKVYFVSNACDPVHAIACTSLFPGSSRQISVKRAARRTLSYNHRETSLCSSCVVSDREELPRSVATILTIRCLAWNSWTSPSWRMPHDLRSCGIRAAYIPLSDASTVLGTASCGSRNLRCHQVRN